jgi:diguanylate cyclase (GGDEF)-like protein
MTEPKRHGKHGTLYVTNAILALAGAALIVVFAGVFLWYDYQQSRNAERERLRITTETVASRVQTMVSTTVVTMRLLDEWCVRNPTRDPRFDPEFNALVAAFRGHVGGTIDIRMVTRSGGIYFFPSANAIPLADAKDRDYYRAILNNLHGGVYFSEPIIGRVTGKWLMVFAYPLRQNAADGLLLFAALEYEKLDDLFADLLGEGARSISVIRADRTVLYRKPFNALIVGTTLDFAVGDRGEDIVEVLMPELTKRIVFYQKLDGLPLYAMVADSYQRIWRTWAKNAIPKAGIAIAVLAAYALLNLALLRLQARNDEMRAQLEIAARYDGLTGLKNRAYFLERVAEELERARRTGESLVFAIADIDRFKEANDGYGHQEGDRALREIAAIIDTASRAADLSGRIGGEEFAILLVNADIEAAREAANRVREAVRAVRVGDWQAGLSVGIAQWTGKTETLQTLMKRADDALYEAKRSGRNRVVSAE